MSENPNLKPCPKCNEPLYYGVGFQIWCLSCGYIEKAEAQEADNPAPETTGLSATITLTLRGASPKVTEYIKHHLDGETVAVEDDGKLHALNSSFVNWFLCRIDPVVGEVDHKLYDSWCSDWSMTAMIMLNGGPSEDEIPFDDDNEDDTEYPEQYHWLCVCGHFQEDGLHCSNCHAEPPWGCPCSFCEEKHLEPDEDDYYPGPWDN